MAQVVFAIHLFGIGLLLFLAKALALQGQLLPFTQQAALLQFSIALKMSAALLERGPLLAQSVVRRGQLPALPGGFLPFFRPMLLPALQEARAQIGQALAKSKRFLLGGDRFVLQA